MYVLHIPLLPATTTTDVLSLYPESHYYYYTNHLLPQPLLLMYSSILYFL
jgi:hypothetical protein